MSILNRSELITYIFEVLLLQDSEKESSHGIVDVGHDADPPPTL